MASTFPAEEEDGCCFAARMNAVRSKSDSEQWFGHENSLPDTPKIQIRIRPDAAEIIAKNRRPAGSMGRMAGFINDSYESDTTPICRRLRSAEAKAIAQRMTRSTDNWADFEGNLVTGSMKQPSHRLGANAEAKEIMQSHTQKCDWFTHDVTQVGADPKPARPSTAQARTSNCDWFTHNTTNQSGVDVRRSLRRVRGEGKEYAMRNRGCKDLLSTVSSENLTLPLYHCPTKESQNYCRQNKESSSVAECMKNPTPIETPSRPVKTKSAEFSNWAGNSKTTSYDHSSLIFPKETESAVPVQTHIKEVPKSQVGRCITQTDKDVPPTPRRRGLHVSDEARPTYDKNRNGQMADLIGNGASSTTLLYPGKTQAKAVKTEEAKSNQEKARGNAVRTLLTHTDLRETPPRRQMRVPSDQVKYALGGDSAQPTSSPPRRLISAEARRYADRQRGTMQDLLTYG
ncbi:hypothetical protein Aperf_G00000035222 [Anoplocephala perfoliata]